MSRELPIHQEESDVMDPFDLADRQIHAIVDERSPNQQYPTYAEDAARGLEIERARRALVHEMLRSPFILRKIAGIQQQVHTQVQQKQGRVSDESGLNFDRHIRVSETEGITEKSANQGEFTEEAIKERMQEVIPKLLHLIACDETDRRELLQDNIAATERALLKKMIVGRERTMIDLAYSIPVRMDRVLTPLLKIYREKNKRVEEVRNQKEHAQEVVPLQKELKMLCEELLQTPDQCDKTTSRIHTAHERYAKSLHALVEPHLRIIYRVSKMYPGSHWQKKELMSAGFTGLMLAAEHYDHRNGSKFNTYAEYWVHQEIRREKSNIRDLVHVPEHACTALRSQAEAFHKKYRRLPLEKNPDDIAILSKGGGIPEDTIRSILLFQRTTSLNILSSSRTGENYGELGDTVPDESQSSPLQMTIEREMEDHVHEVLRSTPIFYRIMFKLRRGLRLRDYEIPGKEYPWLTEVGRCLQLRDYELPDTVKIFPERTLTRILIKIRNGFPLTAEETLIFHQCNNTKDKRAVGLPSPLGPAEQWEDPPEGYLGSLNVEASKANKKQGKPAIIETIPIFDHAEKNSEKDAGYTLEEVATICGVTRERVRQLEKKVMAKLENPAHMRRLKALLR